MSQPDPIYWGIDEPKKFEKARRKLPADIQDIYAQKIALMIHSPNPVGRVDKWERTRYGLVWMARLSDYYRFSYILEKENKVIRLIRIGSHKAVGTEK